MASSLDQGAYSQTNTAQDPDYWSRQLTNPNPRIRAQAELALKQLYEERDSNQRQQGLDESRAQRLDISNANRDTRRDIADENRAARVSADSARQDAVKEAQATRRAQTLQLIMNDPTLDKPTKDAARNAMVQDLGLNVAGASTSTAAKGAYGPGGAPKQPVTAAPVRSATQYTPPTQAFASGLPDQANASPPSFHASRYGNDPVNLGRAKANLDQQDAGDARVNQLLYKRDIGGENFAKIYGTDDPNMMHPGMAPASAIPDIYGGKPTIPSNAGVGYYDAKGGFIGPAYDPSGVKLPVPHGTAGMVGTANLGLNYDQNSGNVLHPTAAQGAEISGQPKPIQNPTAAFTQPPIAQNPTVAPAPTATPPPPTQPFGVAGGITPEAAAQNRAGLYGFLNNYLNLPPNIRPPQPPPQPVLASQNPGY